MWDAATPSHCHVISVAAINAAADLARGFPTCKASVQTLMSSIAASEELSATVRVAAADAELQSRATDAHAICTVLVELLSDLHTAPERAAVLSAAALLLASCSGGPAAAGDHSHGVGEDSEQAGMHVVPDDTLAALQQVLHSHGTPAARHEAYRVLCAAMGQPPALVQASHEGASETGDEGTAQRAFLLGPHTHASGSARSRLRAFLLRIRSSSIAAPSPVGDRRRCLSGRCSAVRMGLPSAASVGKAPRQGRSCLKKCSVSAAGATSVGGDRQSG